MNKLISLVISLVFFSLSVFAELNLASPEELIVKARQDRISLREVILDLLKNTTEIRSAAVFDSYYYLLPELKQLSLDLDLDAIYPGAMDNLGYRMSAHGIRWLLISKDTKEKILFYHQWFNADIAATWSALAELEAKETKDVDKLKWIAENADELIPYIDQKFPDRRDIRLLYRRLLSDISVIFLKNKDLPEKETLYWIGKISVSSSFADYIETIRENILFLKADKKSDLHIYVQRLIKIKNRLGNMFEEAPQWLTSSVGDISVDLAIRFIQFEEFFAPNEFQTLLNNMSLRQLSAMVSNWLSIDKPPSEEYAQHFLDMSQILISKLQASQLFKEAADLANFLNKLAAPIYSKKVALEGVYHVKDAQGKKWIFTVISARETTIYAALSDEDQFIFKSYFNVTYNVNEAQFIASERESDLDSNPNPTIKFKVDKDQIEIIDVYAQPNRKYLKGQKVLPFPNYFQFSDPNAKKVNGTFKGDIIFPGNFTQEMTLQITSFNGYSIGRLQNDSGLTIDLNIGTTGAYGVIYLTTGRLKQGSWLHLRGRIVDGNFQGIAISGGRGASPKEFILKKITDEEKK